MIEWYAYLGTEMIRNLDGCAVYFEGLKGKALYINTQVGCIFHHKTIGYVDGQRCF